MPLLNNHPGSWKVAGVTLPDFGITEKIGDVLGQSRNAQGGSNLAGPAYVPPTVTQVPTNFTQYSNPIGPALPAANKSYNLPTSPVDLKSAINNVNQGVTDYGSLIEGDYNNAINALGSQEQGLRSQADIAQSELNNDYAGTTSDLNRAQQTGVEGQQSQITVGENTAKTAMQSARDMYNQTQQSNIAQLSALGLSSSSVNEAMAERLGVETARRIAGVSNSLGEIRQNATKEIAHINDYYAEKKTQLDNTKTIETQKIQSSLMAGINSINQARNQAASDRARSRMELLSNAQKAIQSLNQQAIEFDNSLKQWAITKANAIQQYVTDPALVSQYQGNINTLNAAPGMTQTYLGNYGVDNSGNFGYAPGQLKSVAKKDPYAVGQTIDYTNPNAY